MKYERLEREQAQPKRVVDHSARFAALEPVATVNGNVGERVAAFCASKRISVDALVAQGARVWVHGRGPDVCLVWGYTNSDGRVVGVKWRNIGNGERQAWRPTTFPSPLVIGNRDSLDVFVAEGETDGARLFDLIGDLAAILVLPAGALAFEPRWADRIPRGATVHLCHDADEAGDRGANKAASVLGGRTVRVRPPDGLKDWCEFPGRREAFIELVAAAHVAKPACTFVPMGEFLTRDYPAAIPVLGKPGHVLLAVGSLLLVYGADGSGKSTFTIDGVAHMAAGCDWLGIPVPSPIRILIIENEGPPSLFQQKLADRAACWDGPDWTGNVYVYANPWGEFSFADGDARSALTAFCDEHAIELVTANPTLGLGVAGSGRPDETQQFVDWLVECGLKTTRAFWLLHHENKSGAISGDWGRHPDTKVQLQADGNQPRTKLIWEKTRWATLPSDEQPKAVMLEWVTETHGYTVVDLDTVGASDSELERRIDEYLIEHPWSSTTNIETEVKGTASRIRKLLDSGRYDSVKGPRRAILWAIPRDSVAAPDDGTTE